MLPKIARSNLVWRLSGLSYRTSVIATHGKFVSMEEYLSVKTPQMREFIDIVQNKKVLEFGCGPGGNLFAIASHIEKGIGIDINRGFIRIANKLKKRGDFSNLSFQSYDGVNLEIPFVPDIIFSIGVFERLHKELVLDYITILSRLLSDSGRLILYFLSERAIGTDFTKRLGSDAYIFWKNGELKKLFQAKGLYVVRESNWDVADVFVLSK